MVERGRHRTGQDLPSSHQDGRVLGESMTEKAVWHIVKDAAKAIGLEWHRTTYGVPALVCAMLPEEN